MGTPHIGQVDNMKMSTLLFLAWLNTCLLGIILAFYMMEKLSG